MKRLSFSLLAIIILSFVIVQSCSTEEEESVAPVVQTPQPEPEPEPVEYTLTVLAAEGGTVSTEGGTYDEGTEVTITATANEGYRFTGWEGSDSTNESLTVTLNSNQTYQALFELIPIYTTDINNDPDIFSYDTNIDYTEQIVDFYPNAFFTSDLSEKVVNGINLALKTAADAFGKYGPVEYWVFGSDKQAALDLINKFCERRVALNQWSLTDCLNRETDESLDYSMIAYQKIGENVIINNRPQGNAGHNGGFQWGIHRLSSSYPFSFDNLFEGIPPQNDFKTVLHEYFHVFQLANVFNLERDAKSPK